MSQVQSLRAQLEAWRLRGEAPQNAPRPQDDSHIPPGYISQVSLRNALWGGGRFLVAMLSESSCVWGTLSVCENRASHVLHSMSFNLPTAGGHDHCAHFTDKATEL